mgnify:CR=1 FL=1
MNLKTVIVLLVMLLIVAVGYGAYQWGMQQGMEMSTMPAETGSDKTTENPSGWSIAEGEAATRRHMEKGLKAGDIDPVTGRKILFYQDPMVPGNQFESPGKSPYMDMMLVPVYQGADNDSSGEEAVVSINSRIQQNFGLRTAPVSREDITSTISTVGNIAWNEREQVNIQARAMGYVEKLYVETSLERVSKGQALMAIYVPEWLAVQEEYLALINMQGEDLAELISASIARMRQAGMSEAQIRKVRETGKLQPHLTITSPINGVVTELEIREGMTTLPGSTLMRINGLDPVWADAEVPEQQVNQVSSGDPVIATTPAFPGKEFTGRVQRLLPQVDPITRTVKARMILDNPDGELLPGMFVDMVLAGKQIEQALMVPTEALIRTGKRTLVMVAMDNGSFRPVEVITGIEANGKTQIKQGLKEGERVVTSGQFLLDSEASLSGVEARLSEADTMKPERHEMPDRGSNTHQTQARVEAIRGQLLTLTHPDIPSLKWPGMTMDFQLSPSLDADNLSVGQKIHIEFRLKEGAAPLIVDMHPLTEGMQMEGAQ